MSVPLTWGTPDGAAVSEALVSLVALVDSADAVSADVVDADTDASTSTAADDVGSTAG